MFNNGIMDADVAIEIIAEMIANNLAAKEICTENNEMRFIQETEKQ